MTGSVRNENCQQSGVNRAIVVVRTTPDWWNFV